MVTARFSRANLPLLLLSRHPPKNFFKQQLLHNSPSIQHNNVLIHCSWPENYPLGAGWICKTSPPSRPPRTAWPFYRAAAGITLTTIILIPTLFSWATLFFPPLQRALNTGPVEPAIYGLAWLGIVVIFSLDYLRKVLVNQTERG